jgi:hypothetical protein
MTRPGTTIPVENDSRRRGLVLVLVIFILGLVCGAALTIIGIRSVGPGRPVGYPDGRPVEMRRGFERMTEELGLNEDQRVAIREIFERSRKQIGEITRVSGDQIREILTEEQRQKFDRMRDRRGRPGRHRRPDRDGRGERPSRGDPPPPPPPEDPLE